MGAKIIFAIALPMYALTSVFGIHKVLLIN